MQALATSATSATSDNSGSRPWRMGQHSTAEGDGRAAEPPRRGRRPGTADDRCVPLHPAFGCADKKIWACCHGPTRCNPRPRRRQIPIRSRSRPLPTRALSHVRRPWRLPPRPRDVERAPVNRRSRRRAYGARRRHWLAPGHPPARPRLTLPVARGPAAAERTAQRAPAQADPAPRPRSRHALRRRCARSSGARSATMATATTGVATAAAIPMRPATRERAVHAPAARRPGQPLPPAPDSLAAVDSEQELTRARGRYTHG